MNCEQPSIRSSVNTYIDVRILELLTAIANTNTDLDDTNARINELQTAIANTNTRIDELQTDIANTNTRIDNLDSQLWQQSRG